MDQQRVGFDQPQGENPPDPSQQQFSQGQPQAANQQQFPNGQPQAANQPYPNQQQLPYGQPQGYPNQQNFPYGHPQAGNQAYPNQQFPYGQPQGYPNQQYSPYGQGQGPYPSFQGSLGRRRHSDEGYGRRRKRNEPKEQNGINICFHDGGMKHCQPQEPKVQHCCCEVEPAPKPKPKPKKKIQSCQPPCCLLHDYCLINKLKRTCNDVENLGQPPKKRKSIYKIVYECAHKKPKPICCKKIRKSSKEEVTVDRLSALKFLIQVLEMVSNVETKDGKKHKKSKKPKETKDKNSKKEKPAAETKAKDEEKVVSDEEGEDETPVAQEEEAEEEVDQPEAAEEEQPA